MYFTKDFYTEYLQTAFFILSNIYYTCTLTLYETEDSKLLLLWIEMTLDLVFEDHTMDQTLEKLQMKDFLGFQTLNNI